MSKTKRGFVTAQSDFLGKAGVVKECYFGHWCYLADTVVEWNDN